MKLFFWRKGYKLHPQIIQGRGEPMVFLHGLGSSGRYWQAIITELKTGKQVSYDLLGFGESAKPRPFKYSLADQAKALRASLRTDLPFKKVILVGHSMGGLVALQFALLYPNKVKKLVLTNVPVLLSTQDFDTVAKRYSELPDRLRNKVHGKVITAMHNSDLVKKHVLPRYARYKLKRPEFDMYDMDHLSPYAYQQSLQHVMQNPLQLDVFRGLQVPVVIIQASHDRAVIDGNITKLAKVLPNARILHVQATHQFPRMQPKKFAHILQTTR